jgi:hypothetical protein
MRRNADSVVETAFSPRKQGCLGVVALCLVLGAFTLPGVDASLPLWIWLTVLLPMPIIGIVLQANTRRIVYILSYRLASTVLIGTVSAVLLWQILGKGLNLGLQVLIGIVELIFLLSIGIQAYSNPLCL